MKALQLIGPSRFEIQELPTPKPGAGEVLVRVRACGICGSDVHGMDGRTGRRIPPIVMGHEAAGEIAALGRGVEGWKVGDRVTFDSTVSCGECPYCLRGEVNLCDNRQVLGVSCDEFRRDGAFAEFVAVPARILYRLPDELVRKSPPLDVEIPSLDQTKEGLEYAKATTQTIRNRDAGTASREGKSLPHRLSGRPDFERAAFAEPVSIALHAVRRAGDVAGKSVAVVGVGMIGLLVVQALKAKGAARICAVDLDPSKVEKARVLGATEGKPQEPVDVAIECVGVGPAIDTAIQAVRKGGVVVLVGNLSPKVEIPLQAVVSREIDLRGSAACAGEYPEALAMIADGRIDVDALLSARSSLEEAPGWFERLAKGEKDLLKVIVRP